MRSLRRIAASFQRRSAAQRAGILAIGPLAALAVAGSLRLVAVEPEESRGPLRYALCSQNVASVEVVPGRAAGARFGIAVQLSRPATEEFARLTEVHAGEDLEIVFSRWLFIRSPVRSRIRSGVITSLSFSSREEAQGALAELESALPPQPCGLLP